MSRRVASLLDMEAIREDDGADNNEEDELMTLEEDELKHGNFIDDDDSDVDESSEQDNSATSKHGGGGENVQQHKWSKDTNQKLDQEHDDVLSHVKRLEQEYSKKSASLRHIAASSIPIRPKPNKNASLPVAHDSRDMAMPTDLVTSYAQAFLRHSQQSSRRLPILSTFSSLECQHQGWLPDNEAILLELQSTRGTGSVLRIEVKNSTLGNLLLRQFRNYSMNVGRIHIMEAREPFRHPESLGPMDDSLCSKLNIADRFVIQYGSSTPRAQTEMLSALIEVKAHLPTLELLNTLDVIAFTSSSTSNTFIMLVFLDALLRRLVEAQSDVAFGGKLILLFSARDREPIYPDRVWPMIDCSVDFNGGREFHPDSGSHDGEGGGVERALLNSAELCMIRLSQRVSSAVVEYKCTHREKCLLEYRNLAFHTSIPKLYELPPVLTHEQRNTRMATGSTQCSLHLYRDIGPWSCILTLVLENESLAAEWNSHFIKRLRNSPRRDYHLANLRIVSEEPQVKDVILDDKAFRNLIDTNPILQDVRDLVPVNGILSLHIGERLYLTADQDSVHVSGCVGTLLDFRDDIPVVLMDVSQRAILIQMVKFVHPLDASSSLECTLLPPLLPAFAVSLYMWSYLQMNECIFVRIPATKMLQYGVVSCQRSILNLWISHDKISEAGNGNDSNMEEDDDSDLYSDED